MWDLKLHLRLFLGKYFVIPMELLKLITEDKLFLSDRYGEIDDFKRIRAITVFPNIFFLHIALLRVTRAAVAGDWKMCGKIF